MRLGNKKRSNDDDDDEDDDDEEDDDEREDEDKYEDLPSDFDDEEIDEDEAFNDDDEEMYQQFSFKAKTRKRSEKKRRKDVDDDAEDGGDEEDDDDGFGELIARAKEGGAMDADDGEDDEQKEEEDMLADSDSEEKKNAEKKNKKKNKKKMEEGVLVNKRLAKVVVDDDDDIELDSEDDDETRELEEEEKDEKRKKMLDDILGDNRRERRLERPRAGSKTELIEEGEYNTPFDASLPKLTLEDAIAALTRAKKSAGQIVDDDEDGGNDEDTYIDDDNLGNDNDNNNKKDREINVNAASLRALRRISGRDAQKAPARKAVTEKMTRVAAYETTKEDITKWQPIVQENRKKETLTFEPSSKKMINRKDTLGALKDDFVPRTEMEKEIAQILAEQSHEFDEKALAREEEFELAQMDPEEAKARRARLAKMKALMFYHEQKAARLKKIKSKDYHRREKKAKMRKAKKNGEIIDGENDEGLGLNMDDDDFDENGLDSEGRTQEERREYFRVRERVLLKHRNTSRWAKRAIKKGIAHLPGTREAMAEQHRLANQLKQKVNAPGDASSDDDSDKSSDSESESVSDSEDEDPEKRRRRAKQKALDALYDAKGGDENLPEGLSKGVFALPFMKRAQEKKKMQTAEAARAILDEMQREDEGVHSDSESDGINIVDEKDAKEWQAIAEKAGVKNTVPLKKNSEHQSVVLKQQKQTVAATAGKAKTVPLSKAARTIRERAAAINRPPRKFEPVLMEDKDDENLKQNKSETFYTEPRLIAEKEEKLKQRKAAVANGTYIEEDDMEDQKALVARAFADDDVEEAFQKEKLQDIETELPNVERPTLLPGWGAWEGERKSTPKWIIDQNNKADQEREKALKSRKDAKLKRVIISERYDKKAASYNVEALPHGFESKAVYEGSMRTPLGADVNTGKQFRKLTKPKILKPTGAIIAPIKMPKNAKPPARAEESQKKKRKIY